MRRLLLILPAMVLLLSCQSKEKVIRYDGLYRTESLILTRDTITSFLRFYPDGKVISMNKLGSTKDIESWFNLDLEDVSKGTVDLKQDTLRFEGTSSMGTVQYEGGIDEDAGLTLNITQSNGDISVKKYHFVKVSDLK
ncbi:MAG: hypothetical protein HOP08_02495 [Cyclobacteriaceae bacterium]|nr:hypothetical protein [Cyclobacteriaceae bacterium]